MDILPLALPPIFGFGIGFVTNFLAIRMLFRPYEEVRFLGFRFQGTIPRRKADIARTVSRTVVSELLREERVSQRVGGEDVRQALEALVGGVADAYLEREYASLAELFESRGIQGMEQRLESWIREAVGAFENWAGTPEARRVVRTLLEAVLDRTPAELLRGDEELAKRLALSKVSEILDAPDLGARTRRILAELLVRSAGVDRSVGDFLPREVTDAILQASRQSVPKLLRRFEQALLAPANVRKIKQAVRAGIETYLLETEGGLVKNLVRQAALLGRERIFREADEIVDANLHRLGELVYAQENRVHLEGAVEGAVRRLFSKTPAQLLASLPAESVDLLYDRASEWICRYLRRPDVSSAVAGSLERELTRLFETPFREIIAVSGVEERPSDRWALLITEWAHHGGLRSVSDRAIPELAHLALSTRIGRPARYVPKGLFQDLTNLALDHLMPVVAAKVPEILQIVDVRGLIEREILAFSPQEVERVILSVARRELTAITWWGGVLGTLVGGIQSGLALLG